MMPAGIVGTVLSCLGMVLTLLVHLSIVRGEKNVEAILATLAPDAKAEG